MAEHYRRGVLTTALAVGAALAIAFFAYPEWPNWLSEPQESVSRLQFNTVELSESAASSLKRLGLTPKNPVNISDPLTGVTKTIHGRFLHLTDFHPDPFYKPGSDVELKCHGGKGDAGKYGDAILGCDSPMKLVEDTIAWIEENLKDKIDFIVWTGDNMRHDNDRKYPRTEVSIFDMNEKISELMNEKFGDLPIPSLGNNDVYPHNLFAPGPTLQTREYFKIWRPFVPQLQLHIFNRGAYFFQEVIPNQLAVLSINTLYLFQSNPLVDNCDRKKEPGYKLFEWLGFVLKEMRKRDMKVWLTGHVPPNAKNYDISCLRKYIAWSHEYRDVIIGGLYGHMNIDHFIPLDSKMAYDSLNKKFKSLGYTYDVSAFEATCDVDDDDWEDEEDEHDLALEDLYRIYNSTIFSDSLEEPGFTFDFSRDVRVEGGIPSGKVAYMDTLRESMYADIKKRKKSGVSSERYSIAHVTSSVVPTFNPGLRVWEYNITDLHNAETQDVLGWDVFFTRIDHLLTEADDEDYTDPFITFKKKVELLKKDKTIPPKMPKGKALGPAYVPQLFTPERYASYFLNLTAVNNGDQKFEYEVEYTTDDKIYDMNVLTVDEWLRLGRKLGAPVKPKKGGMHPEKNKKGGKNSEKKSKQLQALWATFLKNTFVSSDYENLGYG